jgi:hypothetical protein
VSRPYAVKIRIGDLAAILLLKVLIDISAYYVLAENFQPYTLQLNLNIYKLIESYLLTLAVAIFLPTDSSRISTIGIWLLVLMSHLPLLTVFALSDFSREWSYACTFFWITVCLIVNFLPRFSGIPVLNHREKYFYALVFLSYIASSAIAFLLLRNSGFGINFNLSEVYEVRSHFSEGSGSMERYLLNAAGFVINPVLFGIGLVRRRYVFIVMAILSQAIIFGVNGFKIYLFSLPLVWFIYYLHEKRWLKIGVLAASLSFLALLSIISFVALNDVWLSGLFTNRLLVLPAAIGYYHFDFFSNNSPIYLSQSILSSVITSPYSELSHYIISDIYFSDPLSMANTGMLGDMYMNFRMPGLIALAICFSIFLILADSLAYKKDIRLVAAAFSMPMLALVNGTFLGVFLTGGMIFSFLLIYFLPEDNDEETA